MCTAHESVVLKVVRISSRILRYQQVSRRLQVIGKVGDAWMRNAWMREPRTKNSKSEELSGREPKTRMNEDVGAQESEVKVVVT